MNLLNKYTFLLFLIICMGSCTNTTSSKDAKDDILSGEISVIVDETILPIIAEQKEVFESSYYNAKLNLISKPEILGINDLLRGDAAMIVLSRELTAEESKSFESRSIKPRIFSIAYDGIALIGNIDGDTIISPSIITDLMKGDSGTGQSLVIDNPNSSLVRYFREIGKIDKISNKNLQVKNSATEILESVATNKKAIGVLSYNQYLSLERDFSKKEKIRILSVLNDTLDVPRYVKPSQASLSTGEYPLRREIKVLNYQPNMGLGMGFSAFMTGDRGQRIVLKSGLLPATMPGREIIIRDNIN